MLRYSQLLAGHSWIEEYGDPLDPKLQEILLGYSPYHNLSREKKYPEVFFTTSTKMTGPSGSRPQNGCPDERIRTQILLL